MEIFYCVLSITQGNEILFTPITLHFAFSGEKYLLASIFKENFVMTHVCVRVCARVHTHIYTHMLYICKLIDSQELFLGTFH